MLQTKHIMPTRLKTHTHHARLPQSRTERPSHTATEKTLVESSSPQRHEKAKVRKQSPDSVAHCMRGQIKLAQRISTLRRSGTNLYSKKSSPKPQPTVCNCVRLNPLARRPDKRVKNTKIRTQRLGNLGNTNYRVADRCKGQNLPEGEIQDAEADRELCR